jgi:hypothetical protein
MLQVARLSPKMLGDSSNLVIDFLRTQLNDDGGFKDRAGNSDLYYTVFGMEALVALRADVPHSSIADYLRRFGEGDHLDFVHLGCLGRCWANLPAQFHADMPRQQILHQIESHRTPDGGYNAIKGSDHGTVYGCFLAMASYQDLGTEMPRRLDMLHCLQSLKADDGGYANQQEVPMGLVPSTAAAATLLRHLDQPNDPTLSRWLLERCRPEGGFFATPMAPIPDLLSTATALHALSGLQADYDAIREPCLDFIDTLWTSKGAFFGNWSDDILDVEYTYYGLLALGHLSV